MASSLEHAEQPYSDGCASGSEPRTDESDQMSERAEYGQYHTDRAHFDGTEDVSDVSDERTEGNRPASAESTVSDQLNAEDVEALDAHAANAKSSGSQTSNHECGPEDGLFLTRPRSADDSVMNPAFSQPKACPPQIDVRGTWKGSMSNTSLPNCQRAEAGDHQSKNNGSSGHHDIYGNARIQSPNIDGTNPVDRSTEKPIVSPAATTPSPKERRKQKTKNERHQTAPSKPLGENLPPTPASVMKQPHLSDHPLGHVQASADDDEETFEPSTSVKVHHAPNTPPNVDIEQVELNQESSPHAQFSNGLQAATNASDSKESHSSFRQPQPPEQPNSENGLPLQPHSPTSSQRSARHARNRSNDQSSKADNLLHRVSNHPAPAKVTRRKNKATRKAMDSGSLQGLAIQQEQSSELNDWFQIFQYKIYEHEHNASKKFAHEREALQSQLQQVIDAKSTLQKEIDAANEHNNSLTATISRQNEQVRKYESKVSKFKTFVDGLGKDFDSLKKAANTTRLRIDQLSVEREDHAAQRNSLFEDLSACTVKSAELRSGMMKTCQEAQTELRNTIIRSNYLDQQLSEKVGLLTEERDRRSRLEQQLASAQKSDENVKQVLDANNEAILDKLYEIYDCLKDAGNNKQISDMLEKTMAVLQGLNVQPTASADDIENVKGLIESLRDSVTSHLENNTTREDVDHDVASAFQTHLDKSLHDFKQGLVDREEHMKQVATQGQTIAVLKEQLKACNIRVTDTESQILAAKEAERGLNDQNASLQARISLLQSESPVTGNAQIRVNRMNGEVDAEEHASNSLKAELAAKVEELQTTKTSEANLQNKVDSLQAKQIELEHEIAACDRAREQLDEKAQSAEEQARQMAKHTERIEAESKAQSEYEQKRLNSEVNRLKKQREQAVGKLTSAEAQLEDLQRQKNAQSAEMERLSELIQSQKREIQSLQARPNNNSESSPDGTSLKAKCSSLSNQLSAEVKKAQDIMEEKSALLQQVEDLQKEAVEARRVEEQARAELEEYRSSRDKAVDSLEKEAREAKEAAQREAAGLEHFKASSKAAVDEAKRKSERQVRALQERLTEAQAEVQQQKEKAKTFREEVEQRWQEEQKGFEERVTEATRKAVDAEAQRDEALKSCDRLREEQQSLLDEQRDKITISQQHSKPNEKAMNSQHYSLSNEKQEQAHLNMPGLGNISTPDTGAEFIPLPGRPRKKVDRNSNTALDMAPVPAPEELRRKLAISHSTRSTRDVLGPIVPDSQVDTGTHAAISAPAPSHVTSNNVEPVNMEDDEPHQLPSIVEETQFEDAAPSFLAFNNSLASSRLTKTSLGPSARYDRMTQGDEQLSADTRKNVENPNVDYRPWTNQTLEDHRRNEDFAIYEDPREIQDSQDCHMVSRGSRHGSNFLLSQEDIEKYSYQKEFPHPNSASKLVRPAVAGSDGASRRHTDRQNSTMSTALTPSIRGGWTVGSREGLQPSDASSSPDFMKVHALNSRKMTGYQAQSGFGSKHRSSNEDSDPVKDPRLRRRPQVGTQFSTPKRKAESRISEGYEPERKKRVTGGMNQSSNGSYFSPRAQIMQSAGSPSQFWSRTSVNESSRVTQHSNATSSRSHMHNLAGGSARPKRGTARKPLEDHEMNRRFSQELNSR